MLPQLVQCLKLKLLSPKRKHLSHQVKNQPKQENLEEDPDPGGTRWKPTKMDPVSQLIERKKMKRLQEIRNQMKIGQEVSLFHISQ